MGKDNARVRQVKALWAKQNAAGKAPHRFNKKSNHQAAPQQLQQQQQPHSEQPQPAMPAEQQQQLVLSPQIFFYKL